MGFRFRKSFKIAPGLRLNLSKSGTSWTIGGRGATVNVGGKTPRATIGIPGTGVSYTTPLSGAPQTEGRHSALVIAIIIAVVVVAIALS
jgi:hypothetical protein